MGVHHHMNHYNVTNCEYIMGHDVLCGVNVMDLIDKWHRVYSIGLFKNNILFLNIIYPIILFLVLIISLNFYILYTRNTFKIPILYEILFSKGILNSKAY